MIVYGRKVLDHTKLDQANAVLAHFCIATALKNRDQSTLAVNHYNFVTKHSSSKMAAESRYYLAEIYYNQKQYSLAEKICDKANKLNTNYPFWVAKGLILYSDILVEIDDLFNARAALEAVIEHFNDSNELLSIALAKREALDEIVNERNKLK